MGRELTGVELAVSLQERGQVERCLGPGAARVAQAPPQTRIREQADVVTVDYADAEFRRATQGPSAPGQAGVLAVPSRADATPRTFTWNSSVDVPGADANATVRITAASGGSARCGEDPSARWSQ